MVFSRFIAYAEIKRKLPVRGHSTDLFATLFIHLLSPFLSICGKTIENLEDARSHVEHHNVTLKIATKRLFMGM